jgi:hypothetical protein
MVPQQEGCTTRAWVNDALSRFAFAPREVHVNRIAQVVRKQLDTAERRGGTSCGEASGEK